MELGRAGVDVEGVHAAGLDAANGHARSSANEGRESNTVGSDEFAALARVALRLVEIEDEVFVLGEETEVLDGAGGGCQLP